MAMQMQMFTSESWVHGPSLKALEGAQMCGAQKTAIFLKKGRDHTLKRMDWMPKLPLTSGE